MSFELETDSGLGTACPELGSAKLLTHAITRPFADIENRLSRQWGARSEHDAEQLQSDMKAYLSLLNASPMIPLKFRLKVLNHFENELDLFDDQLAATLLDAYKIAAKMLQQAANRDPGYYPALIDVAVNAIEIAIHLFRLSLEIYQSPSILVIRRIFSLERLGLNALQAMPEGSEEARAHIQHLVSWYELLKALDFFGKSPSEQKIIWQLLQKDAGELQPRFYQYQDAPPSRLPGKVFLLSNLSRPDQAPYITRLPKKFPGDVILIPMSHFLSHMAEENKKAKILLRDEDLQRKVMSTEDELQLTMIGSGLILDDLSIKKRAKRYQYHETRVYVSGDLHRVFAGTGDAGNMSGYTFTPFELNSGNTWLIADISKSGAGLMRHYSSRTEIEIGAMAGLHWPLHKGEPELGFIRWFREPKPGEQRLGIEFLRGHFRSINASVAGAGAIVSLKMIPPWPVIAERRLDSLRVFSPEKNIFAGSILNFSNTDHPGPYKVNHIIRTGPNYILFIATPAEKET